MRLVGGVRGCCEREVDAAEYLINLTEIRSQVAVVPPLLTMPDNGNSEETATRAISVAIVSEGDQSGLSFARCPTCPGLGRTPTLHVGCTTVDAIQGSGKDTNAEVDNKLNTSSSQPEPAQHNLSQSSLQRCSYPNCTLQQQLPSSEGSEVKGPVVVDRGVIDGPPHQGTALTVVVAASSNPGPSTLVAKGKRKAEAECTEEGPLSPSKKNQKPAISEADYKSVNDKIASELYWKDHNPKVFGDLPDQPESSYGRGRCMQIQLRTESASNLDMAGVVDTSTFALSQTFVTVCIPGFGFNPVNHEGLLTPFTDERYESDPEGAGLGGLNTLPELSGANIADEPSSMDDVQLDQQF